MMTERAVSLSDFDYQLPPDRIAQEPISPRDHSRLMVVDKVRGTLTHSHFYDLGKYLKRGDVLVLNATRVFPARLRGRKMTGGKVELLLIAPVQDKNHENAWRALVRGVSVEGADLIFPDGMTASLGPRSANGEWTVWFATNSIRDYLERFGEMPLPPYIKRAERLETDHERYQTIFARAEGSIAAPTAGFHFTPTLLRQLRVQGIETVEIILHVGWGTFRPVRTQQIRDHVMLPEHYAVTPQTAAALQKARQQKRRVIGVGTTTIRTLESIYDREKGIYKAGEGATELFIYPGYQFAAIDAMITNFHLPDSTPLLLANAFYGGEEPFSLRFAYHEAIREGYRFYSYGDAMFIQ